MTRAASRCGIFLLCAVLGLLVLGRPVDSAPADKLKADGEGGLKALFAELQKQNPEVPVKNDQGTYVIQVSKTVAVAVDEQPNGYARVWTEIAVYKDNPPLGLFSAMAKANDSSLWGYCSWGGFKEEKGVTGHVFLNFTFLIRTADAKALMDYINSTITERDKFTAALKDYLP